MEAILKSVMLLENHTQKFFLESDFSQICTLDRFYKQVDRIVLSLDKSPARNI